MPTIEPKNAVCLEILDALLAASADVRRQLPAYETLLVLFFHDLVIYLTGAYLLTVDDDREGELSFPFCSKAYLDAPARLSFAPEAVAFRKPPFLPNLIGKRIGIGGNVSFDSRLEKFRFLGGQKVVALGESRFHLRHQEDQLAELRALLVDLAGRYQLAADRDVFADNFLAYCRRFLGDRECYVEKEFLLTGSNVSIQNRLLSAQQLKHGNRAICVGHGEQSPFFLDEPVFFYGDLSLCTDFVSYGAALPGDHDHKRFILTEAPRIWGRASRKVSALHRHHGRRRTGGRILYVPTLYSSNRRYGPYRDISDADYLRWQEKIMSFSPDVTIKVHPKGRKLRLDWRCESRWLEDCIHDYDYYVFDYISTASTLCLAMDRPVLFLDLGIRNISRAGLAAVREACTYHKVDLDVPTAEVHSRLRDFKDAGVVHDRRGIASDYFLGSETFLTDVLRAAISAP
jgi:hypothetical protein